MKKSILVINLSLFLAFPTLSASATDGTTSGEQEVQQKESLWGKLKRNSLTTWEQGKFDLYVPVNTWHNRWFYDREKIDRYNERPWGIGFGLSRFDADKDWHAIYIMGFQDSHDMFEPIGGYAYQKNWYFGKQKDWRLGLGFTAAITARHDYSYVPLPIVLPIASIEYKNFSIQNAYIPGVRNNGNVLFTWVRWHFE